MIQMLLNCIIFGFELACYLMAVEASSQEDEAFGHISKGGVETVVCVEFKQMCSHSSHLPQIAHTEFKRALNGYICPMGGNQTTNT